MVTFLCLLHESSPTHLQVYVLMYVTTCKLGLWEKLQMSRGKRREIRINLDDNFRFLQISNLFQVPIIYRCTGTTINLFPYYWLYGKPLSVVSLRRESAAAWLLGSLFRIPLTACLFVSCVLLYVV